MENNLQPTCEIYVDFSGSREEMQQITAKAIDGKLEKFFAVVSEYLDVTVKNNELFNSPKYGSSLPPEDAPNRYLYFKYRLNVATISEDVSEDIFEREIQKLIQAISVLGIPVKADAVILV